MFTLVVLLKWVNVGWGVTRWYQSKVTEKDLRVNEDCYACMLFIYMFTMHACYLFIVMAMISMYISYDFNVVSC